jgi:hypothetical protein
VPHANQHDIHRELGTAPPAAKTQARAETAPFSDRFRPVPGGPSSEASAPACGSACLRSRGRAATTTKFPVGTQRHLIDVSPVSASSAASAPRAAFTTSATPQPQRPNPSFCSIARCFETIPTLSVLRQPRIACLRLSRTLVYLYRRELELEPVRLPGVAMRFIRQHCRKLCRKC